MPLVYLPLWRLCIQSKPALEEKSAFSSPVPRCQWQGKLWLSLAFWYAFQTGGNFTTTQANLQWRFLFFSFFYYYYRSLLRKAKTVRGVKRVTSLFSCNDFRKLEVCSVLFLRQFDLVGARACPLFPSLLTHAFLKSWAPIRQSQVIACHREANANCALVHLRKIVGFCFGRSGFEMKKN